MATPLPKKDQTGSQDLRSLHAMLDMTVNDLIEQNRSKMSFVERAMVGMMPEAMGKQTLRQALASPMAGRFREQIEQRLGSMGLKPADLDRALKEGPPGAKAAAKPAEAPPAAPAPAPAPTPAKAQTAPAPAPAPPVAASVPTPPAATPAAAPVTSPAGGGGGVPLPKSGGGMVASPKLDTSTGAGRVQSWYNFFVRPRDQGGAGFSPHQAAGAVANLRAESGGHINPTAFNKKEGAFGSGQWRFDRRSGLERHSAANKMDYRTPEAQQAWVRRELDTTHNKAYRAMLAAKTPQEAATIWNKQYEISADRSGRRERDADYLFKTYSGKPPVQVASAAGGAPAAAAEPPVKGVEITGRTSGVPSDAGITSEGLPTVPNLAPKRTSGVPSDAGILSGGEPSVGEVPKMPEITYKSNPPDADVPVGTDPISGGATDTYTAPATDTAVADKGGGMNFGGFGEALEGIGKSMGAGASARASAPVGPTNIPMPLSTPQAPVPIVDPRMAENQRQQLALAMQRLNSGRLF